MSNYFGNFFSEFQCGFRQGFSAQHCLLVMIKNWEESVDKRNMSGTLLTDLSKAFYGLPHDLPYHCKIKCIWI